MLKILLKTFGFAVKGIRYGFKSQRNLRIQLAIFVAVLLAAILSGFNLKEYIVIFLCSSMVFSLEMINTAIEVLVDLVSPEWNEKAGRVKDISAGAVLVASAFSAVSGILLFLNHFKVLTFF